MSPRYRRTFCLSLAFPADPKYLHQTHTLIRTEGILTQLIFEHSLRIRLKADLKTSSKGLAAAGTHLSKSNSTVEKTIGLVTADLANLTNGRDFMVLLVFVPLQVVLCVAFLHALLGWRCVGRAPTFFCGIHLDSYPKCVPWARRYGFGDPFVNIYLQAWTTC